MSIQAAIQEYVAKRDALSNEKQTINRRLDDLSSSIGLAELSREERAKAPDEIERLRTRLGEIDRDLADVEQERRRINEAHIAAAQRKTAPKETSDVKSAARLVGDLEVKREIISETIARIERERSAVVLAAATGDAKAKAESARLAKEMDTAIEEAGDIEGALAQARENLAGAQAQSDAADAGKRWATARKIGADAAADAAEFDHFINQAVAILDRRHARTNDLLKLGAIDHTTANRIRNQRVVIGALLRAGMKRHIGDLSSIHGAASLAEADANLFPGAKDRAAA